MMGEGMGCLFRDVTELDGVNTAGATGDGEKVGRIR